MIDIFAGSTHSISVGERGGCYRWIGGQSKLKELEEICSRQVGDQISIQNIATGCDNTVIVN